MMHGSSDVPGSGVQCASLAEMHFFYYEKWQYRMIVSPKPLLLCQVQYVGNLKLKKIAGISVTNRWIMLLSPADAQSVECGLMFAGMKQCGVMRQNHNPTLEAKRSCSSLWKFRDLLVWACAERVETSLHMLSWSQSPSGNPSLEGKAAGTSSQLPRKRNHWRHELAWQKSQERRQHQRKIGHAIGIKELIEWLQEDMGRSLWEGESSVPPLQHGMEQTRCNLYVQTWMLEGIPIQNKKPPGRKSSVTEGHNAHTLLGEFRETNHTKCS